MFKRVLPAEQREPLNAKGPDFALRRNPTFNRFFSGEAPRVHEHQSIFSPHFEQRGEREA